MTGSCTACHCTMCMASSMRCTVHMRWARQWSFYPNFHQQRCGMSLWCASHLHVDVHFTPSRHKRPAFLTITLLGESLTGLHPAQCMLQVLAMVWQGSNSLFGACRGKMTQSLSSWECPPCTATCCRSTTICPSSSRRQRRAQPSACV